MIATTAVYHQLTLATADTQQFKFDCYRRSAIAISIRLYFFTFLV
ncbi:hypothetical protein [Nostoc sp. FACHB-87]|nr:hypothetical protein [Nostoc sp. FACHB-87]